MSLESPDLVDVVLHHLRSVELHVSVGARALSEQLVVVLVLVIASLNIICYSSVNFSFTDCIAFLSGLNLIEI